MIARASRYRVAGTFDGEALIALEPTADELRAAAGSLATGYNDPHNRAMIANEDDYTEADVVAHFSAMAAIGARTFLLYQGGALVGDADFRHVEGDRAEFAILLIARETQGRGLGTRFARMLHVLAFRVLGVGRCYVTILPANAASLRLFAKLGYAQDTSPEARAYADDPADVCLSLAREHFERLHDESALGPVQITARDAE